MIRRKLAIVAEAQTPIGAGEATTPAPVDVHEQFAVLLEHLAVEARKLAGSPQNGLAGLAGAEAHGRARAKSAAAMKIEHLLSAEDLARILQLDVRSVRRLRHLGQIPEAIQLGGVLRWHPKVISRWLEEQAS